MIPFVEGDQQQLERKRHIGNDLCVIVFLDDGAEFPNLESFKTEMTNVYLVISVMEIHKELGRFYRIGVASRMGIENVSPEIPEAITGGDGLRRFVLAKLINSERAVQRSPVFEQLRRTVRKELLMRLYQDNSTVSESSHSCLLISAASQGVQVDRKRSSEESCIPCKAAS